MAENNEMHEINADDMQAEENIQADNNLGTEQEMEASNQELTVEEKLQNEIAEWKEKQIRLQADFENYKKRTRAEIAELLKPSVKSVLISVLEILDDFDRANSQLSKADDSNWKNGIEGMTLILTKFKKKIEEFGIVELDCLGKEFDSNFQEAVTEIPAPSEDLAGKVIDEVQKGYLLNDKVLRFAKVVVAQSSKN